MGLRTHNTPLNHGRSMSADSDRSQFPWYEMEARQQADVDVTPAEGVEHYLNARTDLRKETRRRQRYVLEGFVEFCQEVDVEYLSEIGPMHIDRYQNWRREQGIKEVTIRGNISTLKAFVKKMTDYGMVHARLWDSIQVPRVDPEDERSETVLDVETAEELLLYLKRFRYASRGHVIMSVLCNTGIRTGTLHSLDVEDLSLDEEGPYFYPQHRPDEGTPLKNGDRGSRPISITPEMADMLRDYVEHHRHNVTDDYGRKPLITTSRGRASKQTIRREVYRLTAPCFRGEPCPGCNGPTAMGAKCPEAVGPHPVRHYYITKCKREGLPTEAISDRCNVSPGVIERHYNHLSPEERMEATRELFAAVNADEDDYPASAPARLP